MNSINSAFSTNLFTTEECNAIKNLKYIFTTTPIIENIHIRSSTVYTIPLAAPLLTAKMDWLSKKLMQVFFTFNAKLWNYELYESVQEDLKLLVYKKENYYAWHSDFGVQGQSHRKLSSLILLSDPKEYIGGELRFLENTGESIVNNLKKGDIIIFPSFLMYSLTTLKAGTLEFLHLNWYGPSFK
tara:strand:+ start:12425 stop:12979 length:555 start_codon:yes stop_codon:yes gene_type:complete